MPVKIKEANVSKNGLLTIIFNQNLSVPDFAKVSLDLSKNNSINKSSYFPKSISTNESLQDILSLKNIIKFEIIPKSLINKNFMNFTVFLSNWTEQGMQI